MSSGAGWPSNELGGQGPDPPNDGPKNPNTLNQDAFRDGSHVTYTTVSPSRLLSSKALDGAPPIRSKPDTSPSNSNSLCPSERFLSCCSTDFLVRHTGDETQFGGGPGWMLEQLWQVLGTEAVDNRGSAFTGTKDTSIHSIVSSCHLAQSKLRRLMGSDSVAYSRPPHAAAFSCTHDDLAH